MKCIHKLKHLIKRNLEIHAYSNIYQIPYNRMIKRNNGKNTIFFFTIQQLNSISSMYKINMVYSKKNQLVI